MSPAPSRSPATHASPAVAPIAAGPTPGTSPGRTNSRSAKPAAGKEKSTSPNSPTTGTAKTPSAPAHTNLVPLSSISVTGGTLELPSNGTYQRVLKTATASVSVTGGKIDLSDNKMIVSAGAGNSTWNGSAYDGIAGLVAGGYNGGTND